VIVVYLSNFSAISWWEQGIFRWVNDDNDHRSVLDQHA